MNNIFVILIIVSHLLRGLYSWLIKTVPTTLSTQILVRMLTYTISALILGFSVGKNIISPSLSHLIIMGTLNTIHILSSYYTYSELPTTVSLPLFYLYPFMNVFLSSIFLNNSITLSTIPWLLFSFIGAILIVFQKGEISFSSKGIISILIAAFTESLIYIAFKSNYESSIFQGIFNLYFGGLIAILIARATNFIEPFDFKPEIWKSLLTFNFFVGFIALSVIIYSISKMSSELFASLAFFGVLSAYIFGELGKEPRPSIPTILGSSMIAIGAVAVNYIKQ